MTSSAAAFSCTANGNGSTTKGVAIAVAQHTTNRDIKVNITGGSFTGYHAMAVQNPQNNSVENFKKIKVEVTGGNFTANGKSGEGATVAVVNVSDSFEISQNPVYSPSASFTVTAKTTI